MDIDPNAVIKTLRDRYAADLADRLQFEAIQAAAIEQLQARIDELEKPQADKKPDA